MIWDVREPDCHTLAQQPYLQQIHDNLLARQIQHPGFKDYLKLQPELTPSDRHILVNWLLIIQVEFKLMPETFQSTISLIDRYLEHCKVEIMQF